jgi:predicted DNA-binding transcriptional regulator AlpA
MSAETTDTALLLSGPDVCTRLGIGKSTLHKMIRAGRFPVATVRICKCVRYRADELARWVEMGCPPNDKYRAMQAITARRFGGAA